jgi:hypothetical protein
MNKSPKRSRPQKAKAHPDASGPSRKGFAKSLMNNLFFSFRGLCGFASLREVFSFSAIM